MLEEMMTEEM